MSAARLTHLPNQKSYVYSKRDTMKDVLCVVAIYELTESKSKSDKKMTNNVTFYKYLSILQSCIRRVKRANWIFFLFF